MALEVLTPDEMAKCEAGMARFGVSTWELMVAAGERVAAAAAEMGPQHGRCLVVTGPGNNGGDGWVAAEMLRRSGRHVRVVDFHAGRDLPADATRARSLYRGRVEEDARGDFQADVVVDALFGSGLSRPVTGAAGEVIEALNAGGAPILAVDLPSGVDGRTGAVAGAAIRAAQTVTFFRPKPGHLLYPGRGHCGHIRLTQIGVDDAVLADVDPALFHNGPDLWCALLPRPAATGHKYRRGHALVISGPAGATGAARLAASGALRVGAGLVTLASTPKAMAENAAHLTAVMLRQAEGAEALSALLNDRRFAAVAIGPGAGVGARTRDAVLACLRSPAGAVLDADALTTFQNDAETLFEAMRQHTGGTVVTPHDGEFARLFPDIAPSPDKVARARQAAARSGAVVVLKGPDTVIAAPDGRAAINTHASPWLATAGSGDVLVGIVAGLLAGDMPAWQAACAAVWMHGDAGRRFGPGLIAEDLPQMLPAVLRDLV